MKISSRDFWCVWGESLCGVSAICMREIGSLAMAVWTLRWKQSFPHFYPLYDYSYDRGHVNTHMHTQKVPR